MNTLILHNIEGSNWSLAEHLVSLGGVSTGPDEITLSTDSSWIRLTWADDVIYDYDFSRLNLLKSFGAERKSFMVEWRGDDLLQNFIDSIPTDKKIVVDNDFGIFISLDLIRDKLLSTWIREKHLS